MKTTYGAVEFTWRDGEDCWICRDIGIQSLLGRVFLDESWDEHLWEGEEDTPLFLMYLTDITAFLKQLNEPKK